MEETKSTEPLKVYNEPTERKVRVVQATTGLKSKSYYVKLTGNEINYDVTGEKLPNGKFKFKIISPSVPKQYQVKEQKEKGFTVLEDADVFNKRKTALENAKTKKLDADQKETDEEIPLYDEVKAVRQEVFIYDKLKFKHSGKEDLIDRKLENDRYVYEIETDEEHFTFGDSTGEVDLLSDLLAYYKFDETSGTTANDAHNSNDLGIRGATVNQTGKIEKAYDFDGSNDNVDDSADIRDFPASPKTEPCTVACWFKTDSISGDSVIVSKSFNPGGAVYYELLRKGNKIRGRVNRSGGTTEVTSSTTFSTGAWVHCAIVSNSTGFKIYVNGSEDGSVSNSNDDYGITEAYFSIGSGNYGSRWGYFNGIIDEVGVWGRDLTSDEISALYNSGDGLSYDDFEPAVTFTKTSKARIKRKITKTKTSKSRLKLIDSITKNSNAKIETLTPVVITLDADQITSSSVRLKGEVTNDAGKTIDASFRYRVKTSETWTNQTDWQLDVGQATFNQVVENLDPTTTYEFKAVARYK